MVLLSAPAPIGLLPRRLAWDVLQAVAAGAYADVALERVLRERDLKPSDRGLVTELAYGAIRQRRTLDAWLDRLGKVPAEKQPPDVPKKASSGATVHGGQWEIVFFQALQ